MLERFLLNEVAIKILSLQDPKFPKFSESDFRTISVIKEVRINLANWLPKNFDFQILHPIYIASNMVQKRETTISTVIPLYRVIIRTLEKEKGNYPVITRAIIDGLNSRMDEKRNAIGHIKREAWSDNRSPPYLFQFNYYKLKGFNLTDNDRSPLQIGLF